MRTVRLMQFLFLAAFMVLDTLTVVVFNSFGLSGTNYISSMAFVGLLLFQQTDSNTELVFKILMVTAWLELNHVGSFPIFISTYLITFLIMGIIKTVIGTDIQEFYVSVILALTLKESITYIILTQFKGMIISPLNFVVERSFWVIVGSLFVVPLVVSMNKKMHRYILQKSQNIYIN